MHDYYYRGPEEEEIIVQVIDYSKPLSIRVSEGEGETAVINLPAEEIDTLIAGLQQIKSKLRQVRAAKIGASVGSITTLDHFLTTRSRNAWVSETGFDTLYVRKGQRYLNGILYDRVIDIASAEATTPGQGALTALIARLHERGEHIYVENIMNPRLVSRLQRMGFTIHGEVQPPSMYLLTADPLST